jgi:hypothetical protein
VAWQSNRILRHIVPQYDELTLFAMSFTCALLFIAGFPKANWQIQNRFSGSGDFTTFLIILFFLAGLVLSLYHALTDRPKTSFEKPLMLIFAVLLNGFSGILAGTYFLDGARGWLVVFPLLNIINGAALLIMLRSRMIGVENVGDDNVSRGRVALAATAIMILFILCRYMFDLFWAQTLAICVTYATNLSRGVQTLLSRATPRHHRDSVSAR